MALDPLLDLRVRLAVLGADAPQDPARLAILARRTPPAALAVLLADYLALTPLEWAVLTEEFRRAPARSAEPVTPPPAWIAALVRQTPWLARVRLQPWPGLSLTLRVAPDGSSRAVVASPVGHWRVVQDGAVIDYTGIDLTPGAAPPPGVIPEEFLDLTLPADLTEPLWAPTAITGWFGLLIGRVLADRTEYLPILFLGHHVARHDAPPALS